MLFHCTNVYVHVLLVSEFPPGLLLFFCRNQQPGESRLRRTRGWRWPPEWIDSVLHDLIHKVTILIRVTETPTGFNMQFLCQTYSFWSKTVWKSSRSPKDKTFSTCEDLDCFKKQNLQRWRLNLIWTWIKCLPAQSQTCFISFYQSVDLKTFSRLKNFCTVDFLIFKF